MFDQFSEPYFTVRPAKFRGLFELKYFPLSKPRDIINILQNFFFPVRTVSYGTLLFPLEFKASALSASLYRAKKARFVTYTMDLEVGWQGVLKVLQDEISLLSLQGLQFFLLRLLTGDCLC